MSLSVRVFSTDASIAHAFPLPSLRETARLSVRADFYYLLNHADLHNPLEPLSETARQIQILLRSF
jgi:hypothetical protein